MTDGISIITTLTSDIWESYANRSIPSWFDIFPSDTKFFFNCNFQPMADQRITYIDDNNEKIKFIATNREKNRINKYPGPSVTKRWETYCHKVFAQYDAAMLCKTKYLIFLDADIKALKPFSIKEVSFLIGDSIGGCMMRDEVPTESSLIIYNMQHPKIFGFFEVFRNFYIDETVFDMVQWDDSYVFDQARKNFNFKSLSGKYSKFLDPIALGPMGEYFDHWMSKSSKRNGFSKFRKLRGKI